MRATPQDAIIQAQQALVWYTEDANVVRERMGILVATSSAVVDVERMLEDIAREFSFALLNKLKIGCARLESDRALLRSSYPGCFTL